MLQQSLQSATSAAISTQSATVAAQSAAGSRAVAAVATNVSALRASLQATLATVAGLRAAARRNVMCMADLVSGALPAHSEPVHGDCNLTTGGVCKVTCKTGYKANGAINHALNKPVVGDAGSQQTHFVPSNAVDGSGNDLARVRDFPARSSLISGRVGVLLFRDV